MAKKVNASPTEPEEEQYQPMDFAFRGEEEEITDLLTPEGIEQLPVGKLLVFRDKDDKETNILISRKEDGRVWGQQIEMTDGRIVGTHYGHNVDATKEMYDEYGVPFCNDCQVKVTESSTEDGEVKALNRADRMKIEKET